MRAFLLSSLLAGATTRAVADSGTVWATPHDSYSSSVGVLGCKVNTDRIAYWPNANQASGPHGLSTPSVLSSAPVWDIKYPSGTKVLAGSPPLAPRRLHRQPRQGKPEENRTGWCGF